MREDSICIHEEKYDEKIKVMLIGDANVGKTSIIKRFCKNIFTPSFLSTYGLDFETKYLKINNKTINLQIWDTAGEERYRVIAKNYFNKSDGFVVVYDITNKNSFENVTNWLEQIQENASEHAQSILLGNKCDLEGKRIIKKEEGMELAKIHNINFYETSAEKGKNIDQAFNDLVKVILESGVISRSESELSSTLVNNSVNDRNQRKKCC